MVRGRIAPGQSYIKIDPDRLTAFVRDGRGPVMRDLDRRATNVQAGARMQVGKDTRTLERSIVKRPGTDAKGPYVAVVTEGVRYALWHHEGTYPGGRPNRYLTDNLPLARR